MEPSDLTPDTIGEWLRGAGPEADVVISSRARLARNVAGYPFPPKASRTQRAEIEAALRDAILEAQVARDMIYWSLEEVPVVDRGLLVERHLISRELADGEGARGVAFGKRESVSIMVLEEDHLRIQVLLSGFQPAETWKSITRIDDLLEKRIPYAFSERFGYLACCPTNLGTGLRASVMLHLPALVMTRQIEKVFQAVLKINLAVRGLFGEGTEATGDFYQISNQVSLGRTEEQIVEQIEKVVLQIVRYERKAREGLISKEHRRHVEDKAWRAYGILRNARTISSEETLHWLSQIRLGVNLGILTDLTIKTVNEMFILTQPSHLQKLEGRRLSAEDRDAVRANYVRARLGEKAAG